MSSGTEFIKEHTVAMIADQLKATTTLRPVAESEEQRAERLAAYRRSRAEAWALYHAAIPALDAITDPIARAVLDLHAPRARHQREGWVFAPECEGCEFGGYEAEPPEWPCGTTEIIAKHYGIELPDSWRLDSHSIQDA